MQKQIIKYILVAGIIITMFSCRTSQQISSTKKGKNFDGTENVVPRSIKDTVIVESIDCGARYMPVKTIQDNYLDAFEELKSMLDGLRPESFKRAVFITENTFFGDSLSYPDYLEKIESLKELCTGVFESLDLNDYNYSDSVRLKKNYAIFTLMKDTVRIANMVNVIPFEYDFSDFLDMKNWPRTFVTKLMFTGSGNCHSLPYLYKILADELETEAWLSFAPNHIYLKHRDKRLGWYNTELTSGEFPTDAWIKASGYITLDAIRNGIYMDTLSRKQTIALCVFDLAKGYMAKTGNFSDGFVLKCCDLVLKYHENNINALLLKAETLKKLYDRCNELHDVTSTLYYYNEMQALYVRGLQLGYREMPPEMYQAWITSAKLGEEKFSNQEIKTNFHSQTSK